MQLGYIGLGKMGLAQVGRLVEKSWRVVAWNRSKPRREDARRLGAEIAGTLGEVSRKLKAPRLLWLMVSHAAVDEALAELAPCLSKGDTVIDGGNSFYKDSMRRARELARRGIHFLDVGVSGGPDGARNGACLMVGGAERVFRKREHLFRDLSGNTAGILTKGKKQHSLILKKVRISQNQRAGGGYAYVGRSGSGHFLKMVHNGIEYGMMQAIGEGFEILKRSPFTLSLQQVAELYNQGSVIESRLMGWLAQAFKGRGENLADISGEVTHSGEGLWAVKTATEFGVPVEVIEKSLEFRLKSKGHPSFTGQVVSALRNQFGGHDVSR